MQLSVLTSARMGCLKNTGNSSLSPEGEERCIMCLKHIQKHINWKTITWGMQLFHLAIVRVDLSLPKTVDKEANFLPKRLHNSLPLSMPGCTSSPRQQNIVAYTECCSVPACM